MQTHLTNLPAPGADSAQFLKLANDYATKFGNIALIKEDPESDKIAAYAVWSDGCWKRCTPDVLRRDMLAMFVDGNKQVARPTPIVNEAFNILTAAAVPTHEMQWDRSLASIPLADGNRSLCLETGTVIDTPQHHMMTRRMSVHEAEIATDAEYQQSRFKAFVDDWLEDPERRRFAQLALAQALLGNPTSSIVDMWGTGRNGKGALFQFLKAALGEFCVNIDTKFYTHGQSKHESEKTKLKYARAVIIGEFESGARIDTGALKSETGGEGINVSRKGKDGYEINPIAVYLIHGNSELRIYDKSAGIKERWHRLKFTKTYGSDVRIGKGEMEAIAKRERGVFLKWLIDGLAEFHKAGRKYTGIDVVREDTLEQFADNNDVETLLREHCIQVPGAKVTMKGLFEALQHDPNFQWKKPMKMTRDFKESGLTVDNKSKGGYSVLRGWMLRIDAVNKKLLASVDDDRLLGEFNDSGKVVLYGADADDSDADADTDTPWSNDAEDVPAPATKQQKLLELAQRSTA